MSRGKTGFHFSGSCFGATGKEAVLTIEHAIVRTKPKPWGSRDLRPWSEASTTAGPIGELWFERPDHAAPRTALLLKLLFTTEPLSIQVHPDDAFARSIGLANGKTEAWYILSAIAGAEVALGLNYPRSAAELRTAITDGSISNILHWHPVHQGDVFFIPAGTIHAIGAGIVLAEIQQHSDATFRLFDYGRQRELHIENAVAVAMAGPREDQAPPERLSDARTVLLRGNGHLAHAATGGAGRVIDGRAQQFAQRDGGHVQENTQERARMPDE